MRIIDKLRFYYPDGDWRWFADQQIWLDRNWARWVQCELAFDVFPTYKLYEEFYGPAKDDRAFRPVLRSPVYWIL